MTVSLYSVLMAVLCFSLFILVAAWLQHKTKILLFCRPTVLLLLAALTVVRVVIPIEVPLTKEIRLTSFYPFVRDFLRGPWITAGNTSVSGTTVLLVIWAAGTVVFCLRLFWHLYCDRRLIRHLRPLPCPRAERCLQRLLTQRRSVRCLGLMVSPDVKTPMSAGLVYPRILLPQYCSDMSVDELRYILIHELTHLKNRDLQVKLLVDLFCCVMWWNPCVYLLKRDLDNALEYKCDLTATKPMGMEDRIGYLQTLLNGVKHLQGGGPTPTLCTAFCTSANREVVKWRFDLVLSQEVYQNKRPAMIFAAAVLALFLASYSFVLQPISFPPQDDLLNEISITPENAYILALADGTYELIFQGEKRQEMPVSILDDEPFCNLMIQEYVEEDLK